MKALPALGMGNMSSISEPSSVVALNGNDLPIVDDGIPTYGVYRKPLSVSLLRLLLFSVVRFSTGPCIQDTDRL